MFTIYHEVYVSILGLQSDALPREKWNFLLIENFKITVYHLLSQHPKPRRKATEDDSGYFVQFTAAGRLLLVIMIALLIV